MTTPAQATPASAPVYFEGDNSVRLVPNTDIQDALSHGGKLAVPMRFGQDVHWIPSDQYDSAFKAGGRADWSAVPQKHQEGFWSAMGGDLGQMARGVVSTVGTDFNPLTAAASSAEMGGQIGANDIVNKQEGRSVPYRVASGVAQAAGINAPAMEQAANEGDTAAILGHAAAPVAALVIAKGAQKFGPPLVKSIAKAPAAALDVAQKTPLVGNAIADARNALTSPENLPAEDAAMKAVRPRNSIVNAKQKIGQALPDARRAADNLHIDVDKMTLEDAERAVVQAKKDVWNEFQNRFLGPNKNVGIDTSPVADRINSITDKWSDIRKNELSGQVQSADSQANNYAGKTQSIDQIETRIQELNNELRSQQSQFKVNEQALRNDPKFAHKFAELDALRQVEADAFEKYSGPGAPELKQRYGALKTLDDVLQRRINVAERAAPVSIGQAMGRMYGVGKIVKGAFTLNPSDVAEGLVANRAANVARMNNNADFLIQQAFKKTAPSPSPLVPSTRIKGLLNRGPIQVQGSSLPVQPTPPPSVDATTRAQRLGLLLPEKAGPFEMSGLHDMTPGERIAAMRLELMRRLMLGLPERSAPIQLPPSSR